MLTVKLSELGGDAFIVAEGEALLQMPLPDNCIVSLSGSNPIHRDAMCWIRSMGKVIFLDTHYSDILSRLSLMKVDRIVGHGNDMAENLQYRQQFYEGMKNCPGNLKSVFIFLSSNNQLPVFGPTVKL